MDKKQKIMFSDQSKLFNLLHLPAHIQRLRQLAQVPRVSGWSWLINDHGGDCWSLWYDDLIIDHGDMMVIIDHGRRHDDNNGVMTMMSRC